MKNLRTVMQIARAVRREGEAVHKDWGDEDSDLGGWCAHSSNLLFQELLRRGIQAKLVWNGLHCFVTYGPYIVDITATQFGKYKKVELRPRQSKNKKTDWWNEDHRVSNEKQYNRGRGWACMPGDDNFYKEWYEKARPRIQALRIR